MASKQAFDFPTPTELLLVKFPEAQPHPQPRKFKWETFAVFVLFQFSDTLRDVRLTNLCSFVLDPRINSGSWAL